MAKKETSQRVSEIASRIMRTFMGLSDAQLSMSLHMGGTAFTLAELRTVAASALCQDETPAIATPIYECLTNGCGFMSGATAGKRIRACLRCDGPVRLVEKKPKKRAKKGRK